MYKPQNMLLTREGILKLNDFDMSCFKATVGDRQIPQGTEAYRSPRLDIEGTLFEEQDDWVALCLAFAELLLGPELLEGGKVAALQAVSNLPHAPGNLKRKIEEQLPALNV